MEHRRILDDPCFKRALPDEPAFVLLARDPMMPALIKLWVAMRREEITNGTRPISDLEQVTAAELEAERAAIWRRDAKERWRDQHELPLGSSEYAPMLNAYRGGMESATIFPADRHTLVAGQTPSDAFQFKRGQS